MAEKRLGTLFFSTLKISACTFGGGFVIVPLLQKRFVEELNWIDEREMLDLTAISQSAPGPIAVNAAILVGYRARGIIGALTAAAGTVLPPLVIISVISLFYKAFRDSKIVSALMSGMLCGVAAVVLNVTIDMLIKLIKQKSIVLLALCALAFVCVRYLDIGIFPIMLVCALAGALMFGRKAHK